MEKKGDQNFDDPKGQRFQKINLYKFKDKSKAKKK